MRRPLSILPAILMLGCVAPQRTATFGREALRTDPGACVWGDDGRICAQVGSPNMLHDDGQTPTAIVYVQDWGWQLSDTGNWQLTINRPDGSVAVQRILKQQVPNVGVCTSGDCLKWSIDVVQLPEAWQAGTYRFRLVCTFNIQLQKQYELTIAGPSAGTL